MSLPQKLFTCAVVDGGMQCVPDGVAASPRGLGTDAGYGIGEVTGRGCRTLNELAATFANPEQAALDLSAWGWVETVYQSYSNGSGRGTRISIQRFETPEGAAQALDAFASTANEPAGTSEVDPSHLQPNQRALQSRRYWGALLEQDGVLLTRVSFAICWLGDHGLILP